MPDDDFRERLAKNLVEQKDVLAALAKPDATHGVPVLRWPGWQSAWKYEETSRKSIEVWNDPRLREDVEPGTWYPADEAAALEAAVEASWHMLQLKPGSLARTQVLTDLEVTLDRLDAIRGAA